jgi:superfamily II DNA or RNA helicase
VSLRPYQAEAKASVLAQWEACRSTLLVLPTGAGKTYTAAEILRERVPAGRILWLAHRSELLDQARETFEARIGLQCEIEKGEARATNGGSLFGGAPVVVASVQSLRGARLKRFAPHSFGTVVIDEAHHAAAKGYRDVLAQFPEAKVLGLTATPDRGDGVALGHVFETVAFEYEIRTAIRDGYLCPLLQKSIECADLDLSDVSTVAGDLNQGELEKRIKLDAVLHQIAGPLVREAGARPTIVFMPGVEAAHALVEVMGGYTSPRGVTAIDGSQPPQIRSERIGRFRRGDVQFLVNCMVLTEGFDAPETSCVAMARPTKSRALYAQCIGRGLRTAPGKTDCLVLDFKGNAGRHKLVTPLDVLAGKALPDDVRKAAEAAAAEGRPSEEALAQAEREAIERARRDDEKRERAAKIKAEVAYRAKQVDPFNMFGVEADSRGPRATDRQLDYLKSKGIDVSAPSRAEASALIDTLEKRRKAGLCTYKQARTLARAGLPTDLSFADASAAIDALQRNGWRSTPELLARFTREAAE